MGCTTSCIAPSVAELNKSVKAGDDRALLLQLAACPKLLSTPTSLLSSTAVTPMHQACDSKQIKVVQQILSFMACSSLDTVQEALLPYCRRVGKQLPTSVREGIQMAVDMTNAKGQTPLMYACFSDCPELVKLLLSKGADPWVGDRCGRRTALHYAAMGGSSACIQTLMKHIPPRLIVRQGLRYVDARSLCGLTPLHYCVYFGNLEALRELLTHFDPAINAATTSESYDVTVTCEARSAPLHFAAVTGNAEAAREVLRYYYQHAGSGQALADPRTRVNAAGQLPWQVALSHHPAHMSLASMLHPGQPLERVLLLAGGGGAGGSGAAGGLGLGPAPLAAIAGAALRSKLVADLQRVKDGGRVGERTQAEERAEVEGAEEGEPAAAAGATPPLMAPKLSAAVPRSAGCSGAGARAPRDGDEGSSSSGGSVSSSSRCRLGRCGSCRGRRSATVAPLPESFVAASSPAAAEADDDDDDAAVGVGSDIVRKGGVCQTDVEKEEEEQCEVCFAARVAVAPAGCRHGLCGGCAEQLCQGVTRRPLHCPFCRGVVSGFVAFTPLKA